MPIEDWSPTLKSKMQEIAGLEQVHDYTDMPGEIAVFPSMIILPVQGEFEYSSGGPQKEHHEVSLTIYTAGQILGEAMGQAVPFIKLVKEKLAANMSLDGKVVTILPSGSAPSYDGPGGVRYGEKTHTGIIFRYHVKEKSGSFTVAA